MGLPLTAHWVGSTLDLDQQGVLARAQPSGIAFVSIQVQLESISRRDTHHDIAKGQFAVIRHHFDAHTVLILKSKRSRVGGTHVNVAQGADYAAPERHFALGTLDYYPRRVAKSTRIRVPARRCQD